MLGSASDAEDLVQETYLRAWRGYAEFERRASMRSWLYRIASNVCLTALETRKQRTLPSSLTPACVEDRPPTEIVDDVAWLEPMLDDTLIARESLRLALIAMLQTFPSRQRAIFILREIAAFSAEETAEILDSTVAAVKSGLQRARAQLEPMDREELLEPTDPRAQELLAGYIAAFERSDANLLIQVLRADATLEATPFRDWASGRAHCIRLLAYILGSPGDWKMTSAIANGQPAARVEHRGQANGVVVVSATASGISRVVAFHHAFRSS
jgi:RNA polymerase sigma-70 factor (ECF subfamily)